MPGGRSPGACSARAGAFLSFLLPFSHQRATKPGSLPSRRTRGEAAVRSRGGRPQEPCRVSVRRCADAAGTATSRVPAERERRHCRARFEPQRTKTPARTSSRTRTPTRRSLNGSAGWGGLESFLHDLVAARGGELGVVNAEIRAVRHGAVARFPVSQQRSAARNVTHVGMMAAGLGPVASARGTGARETAAARGRPVPEATACPER